MHEQKLQSTTNVCFWSPIAEQGCDGSYVKVKPESVYEESSPELHLQHSHISCIQNKIVEWHLKVFPPNYMSSSR